MFVTIRGKRMYLWRAVDSEGEVLDFLIQSKRKKAAEVKLMRKLLKLQGFAPRLIATDKLRSYTSAFRELGLSAQHKQG
jgi:transposase-like protein